MVNPNNLRSSRAGGVSTRVQSSTTSSEEHRSLMQIVDEILNKRSLTISAEKIRKEIVKSFKQSEKEEVEMSSFRLPLIDPISKKRVRIPVRSLNCDHFQCFDLYNFLDFSYGNGRIEGEEGAKAAWLCPHCQAEAKQEQLRIDGYFQEILMKVGPMPQEVEIFPDGSWKEVEQMDFKDVFPTEKDDDVVVIVPRKKSRNLDEAQTGEFLEAATSPRQPEADQIGLYEEMRKILGVSADLIETVQKLKQDSEFVEVLCGTVGIDKNSEQKHNKIIEVFRELMKNQKKGDEEKADKALQTLEMEKDDGNELLIEKLNEETRESSISSLSAVNGAPSSKSTTDQIVATGEKQVFWTKEDFENPANWTKGRSKTTGLDYYFNAATKHSLFEADIPPELLAGIRELERNPPQIDPTPPFSSTEQNHQNGEQEFAAPPKTLHLSGQISTDFLPFQQEAKNSPTEEGEKNTDGDDGCGEPPHSPFFQLCLTDFERRMKEGKPLDKPDTLKTNNTSAESGGTRYWIQIRWPAGSRSPFKRNDQWKRGEIQLLLWECFSVVANLSDMHFNAHYARVGLKSVGDARKVISGLNGLTYFGCKLAVRAKGGKKEAKKYEVEPTLPPPPPPRKGTHGGHSPNQSPGFAAKRIFWPHPLPTTAPRMPLENNTAQRSTTIFPQKHEFFAAPPPASSGAVSSSNSARPQRPGLLPTPNNTTTNNNNNIKSLLGEGPLTDAIPPRFSFFGAPQHQTNNKNISSSKSAAVPENGFPSESGGFFNTPGASSMMTHNQKKQPPSQHPAHFGAASSSSFSSFGGHPRRPYQ